MYIVYIPSVKQSCCMYIYHIIMWYTYVYTTIYPHILLSYFYNYSYSYFYSYTYTVYLLCISSLVLSQKHPFGHVKSESVLCVTVHMNQRPNLDLDIPKDTPQEVIDMIRYVLIVRVKYTNACVYVNT